VARAQRRRSGGALQRRQRAATWDRAVPEIEETLWWLPDQRTLVVGDVLLGAPQGIQVCPESWLEGQASPASIRAALRPLLDRPVERILVSHGDPVLVDGRAALERALRG
jgi:glyoxylase-like metal-dependent hydrolase (beta-lactamase superfamily II)